MALVLCGLTPSPGYGEQSMSNNVKRAEHRAAMLAHVAGHEQSGTSRRAYCAEHGLSEQTLAYWIKRKRLDGSSDKGGFTAVEVTTAETLELCYPTGVRLLLPKNTALSQVAARIKLY